MAMTRLARSTRSLVNVPGPGPTSTMVSVDLISPAVIIAFRLATSCSQCCPSDFFVKGKSSILYIFIVSTLHLWHCEQSGSPCTSLRSATTSGRQSNGCTPHTTSHSEHVHSRHTTLAG